MEHLGHLDFQSSIINVIANSDNDNDEDEDEEEDECYMKGEAVNVLEADARQHPAHHIQRLMVCG